MAPPMGVPLGYTQKAIDKDVHIGSDIFVDVTELGITAQPCKVCLEGMRVLCLQDVWLQHRA